MGVDWLVAQLLGVDSIVVSVFAAILVEFESEQSRLVKVGGEICEADSNQHQPLQCIVVNGIILGGCLGSSGLGGSFCNHALEETHRRQAGKTTPFGTKCQKQFVVWFP